jgi:hypothetical protein
LNYGVFSGKIGLALSIYVIFSPMAAEAIDDFSDDQAASDSPNSSSFLLRLYLEQMLFSGSNLPNF